MLNNLRIVEIELFSFCNRKCDWCPNKDIDRMTWNYLDIEIFMSLLSQLKEINYQGVFSFSRYNEPFADYDVLQSACQMIKNVFPNNKLVSNTNGDYLNQEVLNDTLLDELTIMDYDCNGKEWCYNRLKNWKCTNIIIYHNYITAKLNNLTILYYFDWPLTGHITNRGGNLGDYTNEAIRRIAPCFEPQYFIGINHDGTVSPCCNIRNDCKNKDLIMGSLKENTLQELWDKKENKFLRDCVSHEYFPYYCAYCLNNGGRYTTKKGLLDY